MRSIFAVLRTIALSAAAVLFLAPAMRVLAQHVTTDYDHSANFSDYHTFSFGQVHASDELFTQRIRDEISRDLTSRGWQQVPRGGDVIITAIGNVHDKQEYTTFYDGLGGFGWRRGWGGGGFGDTTTTVDQVPVGTLIVDLYRGNSKQLLFRGMATDDLSKNPDKNTGKLDKAIDKIFNKFPPKSQG